MSGAKIPLPPPTQIEAFGLIFRFRSQMKIKLPLIYVREMAFMSLQYRSFY